MSRSRAARLLVAVVVMAILAATAANVALAAEVQDARLAIAQPDYIDHDVQTTSANGTTIYSVKGPIIEIQPQNFRNGTVVDFGVATDGGTLSYDRAFDHYEFQADAKGTYRLYWSVQREVPVTIERNNTTRTRIETRSTRYEALLRVEGGLNLEHQPAGQSAAVEQKAERWEQFNESLQKLIDPGVSTTAAVNEMLRWYKFRKQPLAALTGSFTTIHVLLFTSLGGLLTLLYWLGLPQRVIWGLRKQLQRHEIIERQEGPAKDLLEDLDYQQRMTEVQNMDPRDVFEDDHIAGAWREVFGETVRDGAIRYLSLAQPRNLIANRLKAMGQHGYVAIVDERGAPDGGGDGATEIERAHLAHADEIPMDTDDADVRDLGEVGPDHELLEALDWNDPVLVQFDLPDADLDLTDTEIGFDEHDLETLVERYEVDMRHFEDLSVFGDYLTEFVAVLREHPTFTDDQGRVDEIQYTMGAFLKQAQLLDDRFSWPVMHLHREALERAVIDHDPVADANERAEQIQLGAE